MSESTPAAGIRVSVDQQEIDADPQHAQELILSGRGIPVGETVLVTKAGRVGVIPTRNLGRAVANGWSLTDAPGAQRVRVKQEEDTLGANAIAATEATASGLTLGLSRLAEQHILGVDPERMAAREENLNGTGVAFEALGAAIPALATGGTSLGARALASTPSGLLMRGAGAAERAAAGALRSAPELARRLVPTMTRGAVEGFGFGVGAQVNEDVLGNRPLALDRALAAGGMGAMFGAGLAPLMVGSQRAVEYTGQLGAKVLRRATGWAEESAPSAAERVFAEGNLPAAARFFGVPEEELGPIWGELGRGEAGRTHLRRLIYQPKGLMEEIADGARPSTEALRDAVRDLRITISPRNKIKGLKGNSSELVPTEVSERMQASAREAADSLALEMQETLQRAINANRMANDSLFDEGALLQMSGFVTRARQMISEGNFDDVYLGLDALARDGQALAKQVRRAAGGPNPPTKAQWTANLFHEQFGLPRLKDFLTDEGYWGARAAARKEVNEAVTHAMRMREGLLDSATKRILDPERPAVSNGDLLSVIKNSSRYEGHQATEQFREVLAAEINAAKTVAKHYELDGAQAARLARAERALDDWDEMFAKQRGNQRTLEAIELLKKQEGIPGNGFGQYITASLGGAVGGTPGALIAGAGALVGSARRRPFTLLRRYLDMARVIDKGTGQHRSAMSEFLGQLGKAGKRAGEKAGPLFESLGSARSTAWTKLSASEARERNQRALERARTFTSNPYALTESVRRSTLHFQDIAPDLADLAHERAATAAAFLAGKAPAALNDPWTKEPALVDPIAEARFARYAEATLEPYTSLARLGDGTFAREHAEALENVYPALFEVTKQAVLEGMISAERVPYSVRLTVSTLFGVPVDNTTLPSFVRRLQTALIVSPPQPQVRQSRAMAATHATHARQSEASRLERGPDAD